MTDSQAKSQQPASAKLAVDDEIDLIDYLRVVWRYRWMILALCLIAMSLTVVTSLRKPRQYQSAVTIVPPLDILQKESGGALGSLNNSLLRQMMDTRAGSIAKMYVEILQSREVADAIVDRFHLMDSYEGDSVSVRCKEQLKANTTVKTTDGGAVKVTVLDRDPNRVGRHCQCLCRGAGQAEQEALGRPGHQQENLPGEPAQGSRGQAQQDRQHLES